MEIWKEIRFCPEYKISNYGRVMSRKGQIMKTIQQKDGYMRVSFWKDNKSISKYIHCLVAEAFIPNPNKLPQVNHKDENKSNNYVGNLEWCTASYNSSYGSRNKTNSIPVLQYTLNGEFIAEYPSILQASKIVGISDSTIRRSCSKSYVGTRRKNNYKWRFKYGNWRNYLRPP